MSALLMVGAQPDNDNSMTNQTYVDNRQLLTAVTQSQVDSELTLQLNGRAAKAYVDSQDATKVLKTYVDSQDATKVAKTAHGVASGVAKLDANLYVPVAQLANAPRGWQMAHLATMTGSTSFSSTSTSRRLLGSFTLPDPGYRYTPIISGAGFETYITSTDARGDIIATYTSQTGPAIGYGTGKLGVTDPYRGHIEIVPDSALPTAGFAGAMTIYLSAFRGFGSGTVTFYTADAWCSVIAMPIVGY